MINSVKKSDMYMKIKHLNLCPGGNTMVASNANKIKYFFWTIEENSHGKLKNVTLSLNLL